MRFCLKSDHSKCINYQPSSYTSSHFGCPVIFELWLAQQWFSYLANEPSDNITKEMSLFNHFWEKAFLDDPAFDFHLS